MLKIVLTSSESDQFSSAPKEILKFPLMYMTGYFCRSVYIYIYKFDLMLHMLPVAHKNRGLQSTVQVLVHFCVTGTSFHECKIGDIIQKVVSLLKIKQNRHLD